jgi:hypothetical protein
MRIVGALLAGILFLCGGAVVNLISEDVQKRLEEIFGQDYLFGIYAAAIICFLIAIGIALPTNSLKSLTTVRRRKSPFYVTPLFDYRFGNVHTPIVTMQIKNKSIRRVEICELELVTVKQWDIPDPWRDATTKRFDDFGVNLPSPIKQALLK